MNSAGIGFTPICKSVIFRNSFDKLRFVTSDFDYARWLWSELVLYSLIIMHSYDKLRFQHVFWCLHSYGKVDNLEKLVKKIYWNFIFKLKLLFWFKAYFKLQVFYSTFMFSISKGFECRSTQSSIFSTFTFSISKGFRCRRT